ncbi:GNAT family N-acetyltransferase [Shewanella intestini]|uniref:GNAT family N-acetyltransferase n=1 Tax=Shewanella intestini TaxID=2017544 RepID=A0ABS5HZN5_9GAMM|nr:GNAT family N-acetyltransferase [Shewanella intestini]MRG35839.1 GNAT family N-acetyltransferase [Shewanella sp. XMDDZSB0408]
MITQTPRLIIRPFNQTDIESLFLMNSIPEMLTYIPTKPFTELSQAQALFDDVVLANYHEFGFGRWAVQHKQDNRVIGFCGPKFIPEFNKVELGYRYFPQYWGQGIGSEAAQAVLDTLKPLHQLHEAIALILQGNKASEAVALKVGMTRINDCKFGGEDIHVYHTAL